MNTHMIDPAQPFGSRFRSVELTDFPGTPLFTPRNADKSHFQCDCDCACNISNQHSLFTLSRPVTCYLELTYSCPNHCPGCGNVAVDRNAKKTFAPALPINQWQRILDQFHSTLNLLRITGGEPTHYPGFYEFLDLLDIRQIDFALLTSGRWPDPKSLLHNLQLHTGFRGFLVSLHGPNASVHEAFTASPGSFAEASQAIRTAAEAGFDVSANCVLVRPNLGQLRATVELALALGANQVIFGRHIGEPQLGLTLNERELRQAVREIKRLEADGWSVKFGNCIPQCFEASSSTGCSAGQTFCTIDPWGNVRPCNHSRLVVGNLLEQSLEEIWWSEKMEAWRQFGAPGCQGCAAYVHCHGGCRAMAWDTDRDPLMRKPLIKASIPSREPLLLYAGAIAKSRYEVRPEPFGPVLICDGLAMSVDSETLSFLGRVDQQYTLAQVQQDYGDTALAFLGQLFTQGFVDLEIPKR